MNAVHDDVVKLVDKELESANRKFPMFRSAHEGCAVILEELEEAREDLEFTEIIYKDLWRHVRDNLGNGIYAGSVQTLCGLAVNLACEAIQVAAMAKKFMKSMKEPEKKENTGIS